MDILRTIVMVLFVLISIVLVVVILMQESKKSGLSGAINGVADTYWGKNKGRSMEGKLVKATKVFAALFFIIALALNMSW